MMGLLGSDGNIEVMAGYGIHCTFDMRLEIFYDI